MKIAVALLTLCFPIMSLAGTVMGVAEGTYYGSGKLVSQSVIIPNMKFESVRTLNKGTIEAHTKAYLAGHKVAEASAKLEVVPGNGEYFKLRDLETGAIAGEGRCDSLACSFTATVMGGALMLAETWIPTDDGFEAVDCYQEFKGKAATYEAIFTRD